MARLTDLFLERRGLDHDTIRAYESSWHGILKDAPAAVDLMHKWHEDGTKVVILPDFDMDGIASGVLGYAGMSELGFDVELFEPDPADGYGFTASSIDRLVAEHAGVGAVITCDVGVSCTEGVERAKEFGLSVIVTDHHSEDERTTTRNIADVLVDPCRLDEDYDHPSICGAHVLWQVLDLYAKRYGGPFAVEQIRRLRVFAAIGTISDSMLMLYENRDLVRDGLAILRLAWTGAGDWLDSAMHSSPAYSRAFKGLSVMCDAFREEGKLHDVSSIDESFIGYYFAPAFNACKRMNEPLSTAFSVFMSDDPEKSAERLIEINNERKTSVEDALERMWSASEDALAPYVYISDAESGLLGLLASRVLNETGQPVVVVAMQPDGSYRGSGRAPAWYPFLKRAKSHCGFAAGHEAAFGVGFANRDDLVAFASWIAHDIESALSEADGDVIVDSADITVSLDGDGDIGLDVEELHDFTLDVNAMRPFGKGFEEPVVRLRFDSSDVSQWVRMGKSNEHCKAILPFAVPVLFWNRAEDLLGVGEPDDTFEVEGSFSINEFQGDETLQFSVRKVRIIDDYGKDLEADADAIG